MPEHLHRRNFICASSTAGCDKIWQTDSGCFRDQDGGCLWDEKCSRQDRQGLQIADETCL